MPEILDPVSSSDQPKRQTEEAEKYQKAGDEVLLKKEQVLLNNLCIYVSVLSRTLPELHPYFDYPAQVQQVLIYQFKTNDNYMK